MINYLRADLKRIYMRIPRLIALLVVYAALIAMLCFSVDEEWNGINFVVTLSQFSIALPVLLGVIELVSVYADDFKAKTMQIAIGIGIKRRRVILVKLIEMAVLICTDLLFLALVALIVGGGILHAGLQAEQYVDTAVLILDVWMKIVGYSSISMILMFFMQSTGMATLVYIALSSTVVYRLSSMLLEAKWIAPLHLGRYTITALLNIFHSQLVLGNFHIASLIGILIYVGLGFGITVFLFKGRELEF